MSIATLLYNRITGHAGTSALIGTRCYPVLLPQRVSYPAVSYQRISNTETRGSSNIRETRYQVDCWAQTYAGTDALGIQVKSALEEYTTLSGGFDIKMARVSNELDDYDDQTDIYRLSIDVILVTTGD